MAKGIFTKNLVKMKCDGCSRINYRAHKNKKTVERKLELKKFCRWCKKHTVHKEVKK
ncbi:MAG TPA: 50S ribosomal protein L33 [Candidatus Jorgensenbacteria bacterium]|nr:50S ribosomal protein L33 [Candidatus Jorgensenbacteria bacterium]